MRLSNTVHCSALAAGYFGVALLRGLFLPIPRKRQKTLHFCPERDVSNHVYIRWCDWRGLTLTRNATPTPSLESVSELHAKASAADVAFRDPDYFVAGEIHNHRPQWEIILTDYPKRDEILGYLRTGVRVQDFLVPFKGDFQGQFYDTKTPPRASFPNSKSCTGFEDFISTTLSQRLRNGSMSLWGKVGSVEPPHLVMPITIEPTKPRMCHDERFLNLWIKDCPLALDYISNLPRYVGAGSFQTTMDEKNGYDHVLVSQDSRSLLGLEWQGWFFVFHTIPFGWKASAYVYHNIGMGATSFIRSLGVPCSQYIDDRHFGATGSRPRVRCRLVEHGTGRGRYIPSCQRPVFTGIFYRPRQVPLVPEP
ncbi:hypothetical protein QZH41_010968, partial [Actinostola sp. cb2023]